MFVIFSLLFSGKPLSSPGSVDPFQQCFCSTAYFYEKLITVY